MSFRKSEFRKQVEKVKQCVWPSFLMFWGLHPPLVVYVHLDVRVKMKGEHSHQQ